MPTSGNIDFNLTARQIITYAFRKLNILPLGQSLDGDKATDAMQELNLMLKSWQKHENIWILKESYITPIANTGSYTLSPIPHRIVDIRFRDSSGSDTEMIQMTRQEYYNLPRKTSNGRPTQWFFSPQVGAGQLFIWPVLSTVNGETLRVTHQRRFEDVDDLSNNVDVRQEHLEVVGMNLAARLADTYGRSGPSINRIVERAQILLEESLDEDRPEFVRFMPDYRYA